MPISITLHEPPDESGLAIVHDGMRRFNRQHADPSGWRPFLLAAYDSGKLIGGLDGALGYRWLHVRNLWVEEERRGQGIGSKLLKEAEAWASKEGCRGSCLDTYDFQARPFYEGHGYHVFGVLEAYPPGGRRFFMEKPLIPPGR